MTGLFAPYAGRRYGCPGRRAVALSLVAGPGIRRKRVRWAGGPRSAEWGTRMGPASQPGDPRIISYLTLRKAVGYLGILLPFVLLAGNWVIFSGGVQQSV